MKRRSFLKGLLATPLLALPIPVLAKLKPFVSEGDLTEASLAKAVVDIGKFTKDRKNTMISSGKWGEPLWPGIDRWYEKEYLREEAVFNKLLES